MSYAPFVCFFTEIKLQVGSLGSIATVYSEKLVGFWLAFLLPTIVYFLMPIVLWAGYSRYVRTPPKGSILLQAFNVIRIAYRGVWSMYLSLIEFLHILIVDLIVVSALNPVKFWTRTVNWDNARPAPAGQKTTNSMITWDADFVDEIRRSLWACKVL